ncbi:hypothetical protein C8F04DRAFT_1204945 [Mycena alexandri]|uniref:HECT domain-containing protein n=1 Tax=Mycena alexandri TaxID=1745969 RepID=A0AAD6RVN5_9AGAR|nr:hypothetical protein C8F04DRAFT_1204945 [Mycena alexandri]
MASIPSGDGGPAVTFEQYQSYQRFLAQNPHFDPRTYEHDASTQPVPSPSAARAAPPPAPDILQELNMQEAPSAPINHQYQSSRPQPPTLTAPASYLPVLGMSTLAPSASTLNQTHTNQARHPPPSRNAWLAAYTENTEANVAARLGTRPTTSTASSATQNVNRHRLDHARASLPRSATSSLVVRRPRGRAEAPPVLPYRRRSNVPAFEETLVEGALEPTCNVLILVYPPPLIDGEYRVFSMLHPDFVEKMQEYNLAYRYELPLTQTVNDLFRRVIADMEASSSQYRFPVARRSSTAASTLLTTLQLLALWDRGRPHKTLGVHLRIEPHNLTKTIADLAADRNQFGGRSCIREGTFIIRLGVFFLPIFLPLANLLCVAAMGDTLSCILPNAGSWRHTCISAHIYSLFPRDNSTMGEDLDATSGGESDEEDEQVARLLWPALPMLASSSLATGSRILTAPSTTHQGVASTSTPQPRLVLRTIVAAPETPPLPPTRPVMPTARFSLPPTIWDENSSFTPRSSGTYGPDGFTRAIFTAATRGSSPSPLRLRGADCDEAATNFAKMLDDAGTAGDYTDIMSPDRAAALYRLWGWLGERDYSYYSGSYLEPGEGDYLTLCTLFSMDSPIPIPVARLTAFQRLGAICGLLFIFGHLPPSLSPAIFQYLIHEGNFHSLHPAFIGEWYPELRALILAWLDLDPEDENLSAFQQHFVTFHNTTASTFRLHDLPTHLALAVTMLFKAVLGPHSFNHPEIQCFALGFRLNCRNGFNLPAAIRNFEGGSEPFLSLIATSAITSVESLLSHLQLAAPSGAAAHLAALRAHTSDATLVFQTLVERFLCGTGIPCPQQFAGATGAFHRIIDLSEIDTPAFRPRMLVWAATGSPFLDPSSDPITIGPIGTHDPGYGPHGSTGPTREVFANNGTFHLQTCFCTIRYPVQFVLLLAQAPYGPGSGSEAANFQEAFDYWFLYQCLLGIGRHSIA